MAGRNCHDGYAPTSQEVAQAVSGVSVSGFS